jgi:hypothetical protein
MLGRRLRRRKPLDIGPIIVLDDFFPNIYSGFRIAEYNAFLQRYTNLTVYSTSLEFATAHAEYARRYPAFAHRVRPFDPAVQGAAMVCYDVLGMNHYYRGGIEIVVPPPDVNQLTSAIVRLKNDRKRLVSIAKAGQRRSRKLFSTSVQLGTRQEILECFAR